MKSLYYDARSEKHETVVIVMVIVKDKRLCFQGFWSAFCASLLAFCNLFEPNKRFMLPFDSTVHDDSVGPK